jgi:hypothetical protein
MQHFTSSMINWERLEFCFSNFHTTFRNVYRIGVLIHTALKCFFGTVIRNNSIYRITSEIQLGVLVVKKNPRRVPCHMHHTSTQVLLSLIVVHIYPTNVCAFLDSVICHRIKKTANVHFQYHILHLIKLCSDSF